MIDFYENGDKSIGNWIDEKPEFVKGQWGWYLRCSDGLIRYLTMGQKWRRYFGLKPDQLQEELRPGLIHVMKTYRQSKAYQERNKIGCVSHTPLPGWLDYNLDKYTEVKKGDVIVITTQAASESRSFIGPMKYFAWLKGTHGRGCQLWAEDFSISSSTNKQRVDLIKMVELKGTEQYMSRKALAEIYPCPEEPKDGE